MQATEAIRAGEPWIQAPATVAVVPDDAADLNQRLRQGNAIAATLVGLTAADASYRVEEKGFVPQVIPPGHLATADLAPHRIRLAVDESGVVTRAWAG